MKANFVSLFGVFDITAVITHIWTVIIAFTEAVFFGGVLTLFLPFLGELNWMFKMFGEKDTYDCSAETFVDNQRLLLQINFMFKTPPSQIP